MFFTRGVCYKAIVSKCYINAEVLRKGELQVENLAISLKEKEAWKIFGGGMEGFLSLV